MSEVLKLFPFIAIYLLLVFGISPPVVWQSLVVVVLVSIRQIKLTSQLAFWVHYNIAILTYS